MKNIKDVDALPEIKCPTNMQECQDYMNELLAEFPLLAETGEREHDRPIDVPIINARAVYKASASTYPYKTWLTKAIEYWGLKEGGKHYVSLLLDPSVEENAQEIMRGRGQVVFFSAAIANLLASQNPRYGLAYSKYVWLQYDAMSYSKEMEADKHKLAQLRHDSDLKKLDFLQRSLGDMLRCLSSEASIEAMQGEQA